MANTIVCFIQLREDTKLLVSERDILCTNMNNSTSEEIILIKCICNLKFIQLAQTGEKVENCWEFVEM